MREKRMGGDQISQTSDFLTRRAGGFTLLELLIALTVLGLISVMLLGGMSFGVAAWRHGAAAAETVGGIGLTRDFLRRLLTDAYPAYGGAPGHGAVDFHGEAQSLSFLAPAVEALGGAGLARYRLVVETAENGDRRLVLSARLETAREGLGALPPSVLADRIGGAEFAYLAPPAPGVAPVWRDTWSDQSLAPRLIRIHVTNGGWPDIIVAPRIARDANCVYDSLTRECRGR
jgi:general secretion pathway protein J